MPDLHKTLIVANVKECINDDDKNQLEAIAYLSDSITDSESGVLEKNRYYFVEEIAIASEHAPFRHKTAIKPVGGQLKKSKNI